MDGPAAPPLPTIARASGLRQSPAGTPGDLGHAHGHGCTSPRFRVSRHRGRDGAVTLTTFSALLPDPAGHSEGLPVDVPEVLGGSEAHSGLLTTGQVWTGSPVSAHWR